MWDRAGCGGSEGEYDHDQSVQSSASEAVSAIQRLSAIDAPGTHNLGFYSFSRGGWIAPLAIQSLSDVAFWISVSAPNRLENYPYMLRTNWRIRGLSESETSRLVEQWITHYRMLHQPEVGYESYVAATSDLFANDYFVDEFYGRPTREEFLAIQEEKREMDVRFDSETGIEIKAPGFAEVLSSLELDTLAIFGEKDTVVNWRRTRELYRETLGADPKSTLTIHTPPNCGHGMRVVETGARGEDLSPEHLGHRCPEVYAVIQQWLADQAVDPEHATPVSMDDLRDLECVVGSWRGEGEDGSSFEEVYRYASDELTEISYYFDGSSDSPSDRGRVFVKNGRVYHTFNDSRWVLFDQANDRWRFDPLERASNSFYWEPRGQDEWKAELTFENGERATYGMRRF